AVRRSPVARGRGRRHDPRVPGSAARGAGRPHAAAPTRRRAGAGRTRPQRAAEPRRAGGGAGRPLPPRPPAPDLRHPPGTHPPPRGPPRLDRRTHRAGSSQPLALALCPAPASVPLSAATPITETRALDARGSVSVDNLKRRIQVRAWYRNDLQITGRLGDGVE